jgi:hypothetical protein
MKSPHNPLAGAAILLAASLVFGGCNMTMDPADGRTRENAIPLSGGAWEAGSITSSSGEQWFRFTASAAAQYIHLSFNAPANLYVQAYDANNKVGNEVNFSGGGGGDHLLLTLTEGKRYYIRVRRDGAGGGAYRIAFNAMPLPPGILTAAAELSADTWADGAITPTNREQWFKFSAGTAAHYLHIRTPVVDLNVRLYDDKGNPRGDWIHWKTGREPLPLQTVDGQLYYIRVTPYLYNGSGAYRIAFNSSASAPD